MIKKILSAAGLLIFMLLPIYTVSAQPVDVFHEACNLSGASSSTACETKQEINQSKRNPIYGPDGIITKVVDILTILVGIAAVIGIISAGLKFVTSGDNPQEVSQARDLVIYALVALIVAALAQALVRLVLFDIVI